MAEKEDVTGRNDDDDTHDIQIPSLFSLQPLPGTVQQPQRRKSYYNAVWWTPPKSSDDSQDDETSTRKFAIGIAENHRCRVVVMTMPGGHTVRQQQQEMVLQFPESEAIEALCFVRDPSQKQSPWILVLLTRKGQLFYASLDRLVEQASSFQQADDSHSHKDSSHHAMRNSTSITLEASQVLLLITLVETTAKDTESSSNQHQLLPGLTQLVPCHERPGWVLVGGNKESCGEPHLFLIQLQSTSSTRNEAVLLPLTGLPDLHASHPSSFSTITSMTMVGPSKLDRDFGRSLQQRLWSTAPTPNSSSRMEKDTTQNRVLRAVIFVGLRDGTLWASGIVDGSDDGGRQESTIATRTSCSRMHLIGWLSREQPLVEIILISRTNQHHPTGLVDGLICFGAHGGVAHMSPNGTMTSLKTLEGPGPWASAFPVWTLTNTSTTTQQPQDSHDGIMLWATNRVTSATHLHYWDQSHESGLGSVTSDRPLPIRSDLEWTMPIRAGGENGDSRQPAQYFMGLTQQGTIVGFEVPCQEYTLDDWLCPSFGGGDGRSKEADAMPRGILRQRAQRNKSLTLSEQDRAKQVSRKRIRRYFQQSATLDSMQNAKVELTQSNAQMDKTANCTLAILSVKQDAASGNPLVVQGAIENAGGNRVAAVQLLERRHGTSSLADLDAVLHVCEVQEAPAVCARRDSCENASDVAVHYGGVAFSVNVPTSANRDALNQIHRFVLPVGQTASAPFTYVSLTPVYSAMGYQQNVLPVGDGAGDLLKKSWPVGVQQLPSFSLGSMVVAEKILKEKS